MVGWVASSEKWHVQALTPPVPHNMTVIFFHCYNETDKAGNFYKVKVFIQLWAWRLKSVVLVPALL